MSAHQTSNRLEVPPLPEGPGTEWPIGLTEGCVRAIRSGRKTQLRQALRIQPPGDARDFSLTTLDGDAVLAWTSSGERQRAQAHLPARPGGRLWVREPWAARTDLHPETDPETARQHVRYRADGGFDPAAPEHAQRYGGAWRHPREMPRWASRLVLEVLTVRLERIQAIRDEDIAEEGGLWRPPGDPPGSADERTGFARWWNEISTRPGADWEANPWVWAVRFRWLDPG
jgi:hypothetical protein